MSPASHDLRKALRDGTRLPDQSSDPTPREMLRAVEHALTTHPDCPHLLVLKAMLIQLQDDLDGVPGLEEAERCLLAAYAQNDRFLEAIEELAHLYDAVLHDAAKARMYAERYIALVTPVLSELTAIRDSLE